MTGEVQVYDGTGSHIPPINQRASPDGRRVGLQILRNGERSEFYPERMVNAFAVVYGNDGRPCSHAWAWFNPGSKGWLAGWRTGYGHCVNDRLGRFIPRGWWRFDGVNRQVSMGFLHQDNGRDGMWYDALFIDGSLSRKANKYNKNSVSFSHNWTDNFQPSPEVSLHLAARAIGDDLVDLPFPPPESDNPFSNIPDAVMANHIVQNTK